MFWIFIDFLDWMYHFSWVTRIIAVAVPFFIVGMIMYYTMFAAVRVIYWLFTGRWNPPNQQ